VVAAKMTKTYIRLWEKDGKYYLSDEFDLRRVQFNSIEERQKWMDAYKPVIGKELVVLPSGPIEDRSIENLKKELEFIENLKKELEFLDRFKEE